MATVDLDTCPSGECSEYVPGAPVPVLIHTRQAYEECAHLAYLMTGPGPVDDPWAWLDGATAAYARSAGY